MTDIRRYWIAPTGEIFSSLPEMWHNISPFTQKVALVHGWKKKVEIVETSSPVRICTKYELVTCLQEYFPELLDTLKVAYANSADLQFYWNTVVQLDRDNDDFKGFVAQLGIAEEQLDAIFAKIEQ